ncbi:hypothetical protein [Legionella jamestowniensis]|uniref:Uncharacterized protein n=1 Tax=Legionella jamestowniensis TaxID=455 RepID=A0A0W0UHL0_9GAMM|nr:hypothetical protein [Legionella jamestowniensis]KTD07363.1 hypothetical protein Ljam_1558 [Legionella jamestowniensis]OCH97862.1 hypothetical protein A8135_01165 [Legionella jamestowniensis]SFL94062.1 hypothetical protein SAMN02746073_2653 [Legionella jamestowniensis DSM 19215]
MSNEEKFTGLTIETLVLVAVWENPFVFQGCFKITNLLGNTPVLFFFRCNSLYEAQTDILDHDFSPEQYKFTHLYNERGLIQLNTLNQVQENALYLLKYALHVTLKEMLSSRKLHFTAIDDMAMHAFINKIQPILNQDLRLPEEEHIGFAVAMDFCPEEETGLLAALTLLRQLKI